MKKSARSAVQFAHYYRQMLRFTEAIARLYYKAVKEEGGANNIIPADKIYESSKSFNFKWLEKGTVEHFSRRASVQPKQQHSLKASNWIPRQSSMLATTEIQMEMKKWAVDAYSSIIFSDPKAFRIYKLGYIYILKCCCWWVSVCLCLWLQCVNFCRRSFNIDD